ncbi:MAG TPA: AAA family ATPase [Thermoplasmata archaeon]|nr:AAA family ATPase [Thermoplasmata archaeon]
MGEGPGLKVVATPQRPPVVRRLALTGTPGVGKSAVNRYLENSIPTAEVGDLAVLWSAFHGSERRREVDLTRLATELRRHPRSPPMLVVGHLAHLLPIRDVVVLRCHPFELGRRLEQRARTLSRQSVRANVLAETVDIVFAEAKSLGRRVWSIDTTRSSPGAVARRVLDLFLHRSLGRTDRVDWLADPRVTEHLLVGEPRSRSRGRRRVPRSRRPLPR